MVLVLATMCAVGCVAVFALVGYLARLRRDLRTLSGEVKLLRRRVKSLSSPPVAHSGAASVQISGRYQCARRTVRRFVRQYPHLRLPGDFRLRPHDLGNWE